MCGIAGQILKPGSTVSVRALRECTDRMMHRGPDDCGYWLADSAGGEFAAYGDRQTHSSLGLPILSDETPLRQFNVGLGFRRLAILDPSPSGHQPIFDRVNGQCLVFNGEIYNYEQLRTELEECGIEFFSSCDSEVLLRSWTRWGPDCIRRLDGMFAGALIDLQRGVATLFRDPFGIKPLYWAESTGSFSFASEISGLLSLDPTRRKANRPRLIDFLLSGISDHKEDTCFEGILQLPPASFMEVPLDLSGRRDPIIYWRLERNQQLGWSTADQAAEAFTEIIRGSVATHSRSDTKIGASNSGGLDSSTIVALYDQMGLSRDPLDTFSYDAAPASTSEIFWSRSMEARVDCRPHHFSVPLENISDDLEELLHIHAEPFSSPAIVAQLHLYRTAAACGIKVLLDGHGADELLAGYESYVPLQIGWLHARGQTGASRSLCEAHAKTLGESPANLFKDALQRSREPTPANPPCWIDSGWLKEAGTERPPLIQPNGLKPLHEHLRYSIEMSLPFLLRCADRNSMSSSVECRVPFMTQRLAEFCFSLPEEFLLNHGGTGKWILRRAMKDLLSPEVLARKRKVGFASLSEEWVRSLIPWVEETLGIVREEKPAFLDYPAVERSWQRIQSSLTDPSEQGVAEFENGIFRPLIATRWIRRYGVEL